MRGVCGLADRSESQFETGVPWVCSRRIPLVRTQLWRFLCGSTNL